MIIRDPLDLLASPVLHGRVTRLHEHRPWPMPDRPWVMGQTWTDLLFAHWSVAPEALRGVVPADCRWTRTRAGSRFAVATARRFYRLPCFRARASISSGESRVCFDSERVGPEAPAPAVFHGAYCPAGDVLGTQPGSIEQWLADRYCLYTLDERRTVLRGEIHHPPWSLQPARADIDVNTMATEVGLRPDGEPLLHFFARQDVIFWSLQDARG